MVWGKWVTAGVLLFSICAAPALSWDDLDEDDDPDTGPDWTTTYERSSLYVAFAREVLKSARVHFPQWISELRGTVQPSGYTGIRIHASPFDERRIDSLSRWLFWKRRPPANRPSTKHFQILAFLASEVRKDLCVKQTCGKLGYAWTESNFTDFENRIFDQILGEMEYVEHRIRVFHRLGRPPTDFEYGKLLEVYLKIWSLGALLEIESDIFLSSFTFKGAHRETLRQRFAEYSEQISGCRVALMRMTDARYRW